jgi:hypothetical protein
MDFEEIKIRPAGNGIIVELNASSTYVDSDNTQVFNDMREFCEWFGNHISNEAGEHDRRYVGRKSPNPQRTTLSDKDIAAITSKISMQTNPPIVLPTGVLQHDGSHNFYDARARQKTQDDASDAMRKAIDRAVLKVTDTS